MNESAESRKRETFVSVVVLARNLAADRNLDSISTITAFLGARFDDYEVLLIEDQKHCLNHERLAELLQEADSIRMLELAYSVSQEVAMTIGLETAIGDFVVLFDPEQDPVETIDAVVDQGLAGSDVVVGVASNARRGILYRITRPAAESLLRSIGYNLPRNATTLRCLSREAIQASTKGRNYHHRLFMRISQCGLRIDPLVYEIIEPGRARKTFADGLKDAMRILVFNSTTPLRMMSFVGFLGSFFAFSFATYSFFSRLLKDNVADGWSSLVVFMSFLFMLLFVMMSFFGEYLGRLLNEQSPHEPFWIIDEKVSSVMLKKDRENVTSFDNTSHGNAGSAVGS